VRTQEDQADHAGVKFLNATGQSPKGMVELFTRMTNEALFNSRFIDPYLQTHPMPAERVATLIAIAKSLYAGEPLGVDLQATVYASDWYRSTRTA